MTLTVIFIIIISIVIIIIIIFKLLIGQVNIHLTFIMVPRRINLITAVCSL